MCAVKPVRYLYKHVSNGHDRLLQLVKLLRRAESSSIWTPGGASVPERPSAA